MMVGPFATGTVEGTGSAINVSCGFTPDYVKVMNIDGDAFMEYTSDMTSGEAFKTIADGTTAQIATGGVSPYVGSAATAAVGFTIGADTDVNASAETIMWVAFSKD